MKVNILILASICISAAAVAQTVTVPYNRGTGNAPLYVRTHVSGKGLVFAATAADRLAAELQLDKSKTEQLRVILDQQRLKLDEFLRDQERSGQKPTVEAVMAVRQRLQEQSLNKLRSILTPEQLQRLAALGGSAQLAGPSDGLYVRAEPRGAYCDATGKCIQR